MHLSHCKATEPLNPAHFQPKQALGGIEIPKPEDKDKEGREIPSPQVASRKASIFRDLQASFLQGLVKATPLAPSHLSQRRVTVG